MHDNARKLSDAVGFFKLAGAAAAPASRAVAPSLPAARAGAPTRLQRPAAHAS
jgi:hypothetical protein